MRLDEYLVNKHNIESRNKATKLIESGFVLINNIVVNKKNYIMKENDKVQIVDDIKYVARSGYKLEYAIETFKIDCHDKIIIDIGASTGGFSDVCLQNGAKKVFCVDIGKDQLHHKIANNENVVILDKTNVKNLSTKLINEEIDIVVSDISFISSKYMFKAIKNLRLKKNANIISLIKPQFELDNKIVSKQKGFVSERFHQQAIDNVCNYAKENNFKIISIIESPIKGAKKQNKEYLLWVKNE